jgi:tetratricopeptide (TPR) repeat protein
LQDGRPPGAAQATDFAWQAAAWVDNRCMKLWVGALVVVFFAMLAGAAHADQKDPRLDKLFQQLKTSSNTESSQPIEEQIWEIWLESGDQNVDALMAIGVAALNDSDYAQAYRAFSRIVDLAPNFAEGWNKRATVLYLMGRYDDSMKDIAKTLALEPRHFGALSGLGLCNAQLKKEKEALDAFEKALAINPNMPGIKLDADQMKKQLGDKSI